MLTLKVCHPFLIRGNAVADVHQAIFYPVGNGDTTQIVLSKGRRVLFDFCHRDKAEDANTPEIDLKARLKEDLKAANRDYFDVVAFTHADLDHNRHTSKPAKRMSAT